MKEYFKLIRQALREERAKGEGTYYEAHHIVPQSFNKVSTTVLLTPEEHYRCHKYLAEHFKNHSIYGKKMLWGYHRLSYDGKRKMTEEEYGEARRILQALWKRPKTEEHKNKIGKTRAGKKTIIHPVTRDIKYVTREELERYIREGWENTNYTKGLQKKYTPEGLKKLAEARRKDQTGKTGLQAKAAKGPYTVEFEDGRIYTEGSYPELAKASGLKMSTLQYRHVKGTKDFLKGWKVH